MSGEAFVPTPEQDNVIRHKGSAIITACPGAGKTRIMVERARYLLRTKADGCGIAFLSFTRAAVSELENGLRREGLLPSPVFPHFIGTFDSFIWQFMIAPFGIPNIEAAPRLVPDKSTRMVQPFERAQPLPLSCFERATGKINGKSAGRYGFEVSETKPALIKAFETTALKMLTQFSARGQLDFDDARDVALIRLADGEFSVRFSSVLAARFSEIVVDEAQDCNPSDLKIIKWLRNAGIQIKVVCDPNQSIYEFRGGITDQLFSFTHTFSAEDQLHMSGNFRSSPNICKAIVMLRASQFRLIEDKPLGESKNELAPICILSYAGQSVPATIGQKFTGLLKELKIDVASAPVLAATKDSGFKAIGQPATKATKDLTFRLAQAVSDFYFSFDDGNQKSVMEEMHKIILELEGRLSGRSYHQYVLEHDVTPDQWRPQILHILRTLKYDSEIYADVNAWHDRAKQLLAPCLPVGGPSIAQRLKKNRDIVSVMRVAHADCPPAKTIHSVKGMEFLAVCVVTVTKTLKGILDYLETGARAEEAEEARKLYVAASRAQRLLAIAAPRSQSARLAALLRTRGAEVTILNI